MTSYGRSIEIAEKWPNIAFYGGLNDDNETSLQGLQGNQKDYYCLDSSFGPGDTRRFYTSFVGRMSWKQRRKEV